MRHRLLLTALLLATSGCSPEALDSDSADEIAGGPSLSWQAVDSVNVGDPLPLQVTASAPTGVARVAAFFRTAGDQSWRTAPTMERDGEIWTTEIPSEQIGAPAMELYFRGETVDGLISYLPEEGVQGPFQLSVNRVGQPIPFAQDFDGLSEGGLAEVGWTSESTLLRGYEWRLTTQESFSGTTSAYHRRIPSSILGEVEDWLISPPIDLSTVDAAMISWVERGTNSDLADNSLWVSTGSPDPGRGEFVEFTQLDPPPEGEWRRIRAVDLSDLAGETAVTFAWKYRQIGANEWWIDDVRVDALSADLHVRDVTWEPNPVAPGESGELIVLLDNLSPVAASGVTLTAIPDAHVEFGEPVPVGPIASEAQAEVRLPFTVHADAPENVRVNLDMVFEDPRRSWFEPQSMLVGQASIARVDYQLDPAGEGDAVQLVRMTIGAGDPDDPDFSVPIENELRTGGEHIAEIDVTDFYPYLPPQPGPNRWWLRVESGPSGAVRDFSITHSAEPYESTDTGGFTGFAPAVYFLPERANPTLGSQSTTPSPVQPGDSVTWRPTLRNSGASTTGPTHVTVHTDDPDITLVDSGPQLIHSTGFARNTTFTPTFSFDVSADRTSSIPARFIATVEDDFEAYEIPIDVPIPYPFLAVTGVVIDDRSGNDDGRLDEGERARLEITLTNVGGLATDGPIACLLSKETGDPEVTLHVFDGLYSSLSAGSSSMQRDFDIEVTSGNTGESIGFLLDCEDRSKSYQVPFDLVLGQRPWLRITTLPDPVGDNLNDYRFDVLQGYFRATDDSLELMLESAEPFGSLDGLFIDVWGSSPGSPYSFHNITINGTRGSIRGFASRFQALGPIEVEQVDERRVLARIPLEAMDLRTNQFNLGFGVGFCGGTAQFCDHYPDGWGAPYTGLVTSRWALIRW
ncbi:MAG: hypothetical protein EA397_08560 [Deltaproteobacteria bacterium]|nr:MAG: hypothetical protein EA397_08560 [Deltaproteobacteria bacterium]